MRSGKLVTNEDELGMPSGGLTATLAVLADSPVSWQQLGKFSGVTRY